MSGRAWEVGDAVAHQFNPELGPGMITGWDGRVATVLFPDQNKTLAVAASSGALVELTLEEGGRARLASGEEVVIRRLEDGTAHLADGREVPTEQLWPIPRPASPVDRLIDGKLDPFPDFLNRLDALRLDRLRRSGGFGSFLGGRVELFPHQLYVADRATTGALRDDRAVRWLLADEVGLGKTVEACFILNRLLHEGRVERALVVAPESLVVQWLGELWRKFHRTFVLLDDSRLADVRREYGRSTNPFEMHPRSVVSIERLEREKRLAKHAAKAGIDLLVVDEAHRLRRPAKEEGDRAYKAIAKLTQTSRHVLLLTATPLEEDAHGFFRLLQLLRPDEFPDDMSFKERLARKEPLPPCTSSTRRSDIGGLPPRRPVFIELDEEAWEARAKLVHRLRSHRIGGHRKQRRTARRQKADRLKRALASGVALIPALPEGAKKLVAMAEAADATDPRLEWLIEQAPGWRRAREKTLVFVAHQETLEWLKKEIAQRAHIEVAVFHEGLRPERRDMEVARFRLPEGPGLLISTEAGGEGRNFQFCRRLVLFDLPWKPSVVEQRIGRLDRIGRTDDTEIIAFVPPPGPARVIFELYRRTGLFEEPLGGVGRELAHLGVEITQRMVDPKAIRVEHFNKVLDDARQAVDRVRKAAYAQLHRKPYRPEEADAILERVPEQLDEVTEALVTRATSRFGFEVEEQSQPRTWRIELGPEALIDGLPGVKAGSVFTGTFDRAHAVANETLDFYGAGHALVEGVIAELEDGPRGRVAVFTAESEERADGLLALYKTADGFEALVVDGRGQRRDDLVDVLFDPNLRPRPVNIKRRVARPDWKPSIRRLAEALPYDRVPEAVALFSLRPADELADSPNPGVHRPALDPTGTGA